MSRAGIRSRIAVAGYAVMIVWVMGILTGSPAGADPNDDIPLPDIPPDSAVIIPLPVITPTPSNWTPRYPFPYDQIKDEVTGADITAMGEMCQWYSAQYAALRSQIDRLQFNRIGPDDRDYNYARGNVQQQVDIVSRNIGQAVDFLGPRVHSLTQAQSSFGDSHFAVYKGEAFYKLWEQLSNVNNGILAHQPDWFTGPSVQKAKRWGSDIQRAHVCG
ncbi:hypothetical protein [Mycobacterium sp. E1747]|uniref:hypothetical protein n=1 Tax=Mycobacterium sp. E1747 TaxID=1834128 RepID=UPI000AA70B3B|nr:hypothetical protein [Mycobacterium sp. E1747]